METAVPQDNVKSSHTRFLVSGVATHVSPVVYCSRGFRALFGLSKSEVLSRPHPSWLCSPPIGAQDKQLADVAHPLRFTEHSIAKKLNFLECYAIAEQEEVRRARPSAKLGVALVLSRNATGEIFTCEIATFTFESPTGGIYSTTLLSDVTDQVSVGSLLSVAGSGEYFRLLRGRKLLLRDPQLLRCLRTAVVPVLQAGLERPLSAVQPQPASLETLPEFLPGGGLAAEALPLEVPGLLAVPRGQSQPSRSGGEPAATARCGTSDQARAAGSGNDDRSAARDAQ